MIILALAWFACLFVVAVSVVLPAPARGRRWWDDLGERGNR